MRSVKGVRGSSTNSKNSPYDTPPMPEKSTAANTARSLRRCLSVSPTATASARVRGAIMTGDFSNRSISCRLAGGDAVRSGDVQMDLLIDDMPDFKRAGLPIGDMRFNVERKGKRVKILPA